MNEQKVAPTQRPLKVVRIDAQFQELPGSACNQIGKGTGSNVRIAAARAFANLLKQPKLRRKHFTTIKAIITVGTVVPDGGANE